MITGKALERLLAESGFSAVKLDSGNRQLREEGRLPKEGRGPHAPRIGPEHAAAMLIAYAGANKAVRMPARLKRLENIRDEGGRTLLAAMTACLASDDIEPALISISRIHRVALFRFAEGVETRFASRKMRTSGSPGRLDVECVLDGTLIANVRRFLSGAAPMVSEPDEVEDGE